MTQVNNKKLNIGPFFVFLASLCFSIGGLCIKSIGWNAMAINGGRNILAALVFGIYLLITRHKLVINKAVIIGALSMSATTILFTFANKMTTAANTIILQYTAPIFVVILSALIFKVKPKKLDVIAIILIFGGVVCFFIDSLSAGNMLGNGIALLSGLTYAGIFMMNTSKNADSLSSTFFGMCINVIVGLPFVFRQDYSGTTAIAWVAFLCLGLFQVGFGYVFLNIGLKTTPATMASLVCGLEPVLNPIWVAIVYHELLSPLALVGAAIVFLTVIIYNVLKTKTAS